LEYGHYFNQIMSRPFLFIIFIFLLLVGWNWVPRYLLKSLGTAATLAYCTNPKW
jgi:hypothetical protein